MNALNPQFQEWEVSDKEHYNFEDYFLIYPDGYMNITVFYLFAFDNSGLPFTLQHTESERSGKPEVSTEYFSEYLTVLQRKSELIKKFKASHSALAC